MIVVGVLHSSQNQTASLTLNSVELNEGTIPVEVSVLGERMEFNTLAIDGQNEAETLSVSIPIHCVSQTLVNSATQEQMYFYSLNSTFRGNPLQKGDIVFAKKPHGIL